MYENDVVKKKETKKRLFLIASVFFFLLLSGIPFIIEELQEWPLKVLSKNIALGIERAKLLSILKRSNMLFKLNLQNKILSYEIFTSCEDPKILESRYFLNPPLTKLLDKDEAIKLGYEKFDTELCINIFSHDESQDILALGGLLEDKIVLFALVKKEAYQVLLN